MGNQTCHATDAAIFLSIMPFALKLFRSGCSFAWKLEMTCQTVFVADLDEPYLHSVP